MSIEYLPVGIACNLKCGYCYQEPMRDAGNINTPIDWSAARAQLDKENYKFTVFGGEALLAPISHLEEVFAYGKERYGQSSVQTNGSLITDEHIDLFKKYSVSVGVSVDGPGHLNDARSAGSLEQTRAATEATHRAIIKLCQAGITPSIIVTLTRANADTREKLGQLVAWFCVLESYGIGSINLHILEVEKGMEGLALTNEQNIQAFDFIYGFSRTSNIGFKPFTDIRRLLLQEELDRVSCIWNACDPITTHAVQGVSPDGTRSNCGRTNKDGVNWVKADKPGMERYLVLHQTPQEDGGCKDCRFFAFCKGNCPGTAIDGDWRNRTEHCSVWYFLFEMIERSIIAEHRAPITRSTSQLKALEEGFLKKWQTNLSGESNSHGDTEHGDAPHGDIHGDAPHGDHHGDSDQRIQSSGVAVSWV